MVVKLGAGTLQVRSIRAGEAGLDYDRITEHIASAHNFCLHPIHVKYRSNAMLLIEPLA